MSEFSFNKKERLKSMKAISYLFNEGKSVYSYPVKLFYSSHSLESGTSYPVRCGVSVAKKKYKKAVERNLLKRRMREAYRQNKKDIVEIARAEGIIIHFFFLYLSGNSEDYTKIEKGIKNCLVRVVAEIRNGK